jgi:hypothetical protein
VKFVLERLRPGSVVCMHDGRPPDEPAELSRTTREATVEAVGVILEAMTARGLRSVASKASASSRTKGSRISARHP